MAINATLRFDNIDFNVLKFDYKFSCDTKKKVPHEKEKTKYDFDFDKYKAERDAPQEAEQLKTDYAEYAAQYSGKDEMLSHEKYVEAQKFEKVDQDQYFPQSKPKGGLINFDVLAKPDGSSILHEWLLDLDKRKSGAFTFQLSIGGKKAIRTIAFTDAYCVRLKEIFESQKNEQMIFRVTLCALCIHFGKEAVFTHTKLIEEREKKAQEQKAKEEAEKAEAAQQQQDIAAKA
jgi:hypothetical protein